MIYLTCSAVAVSVDENQERILSTWARGSGMFLQFESVRRSIEEEQTGMGRWTISSHRSFQILMGLGSFLHASFPAFPPIIFTHIGFYIIYRYQWFSDMQPAWASQSVIIYPFMGSVKRSTMKIEKRGAGKPKHSRLKNLITFDSIEHKEHL